MLLDTVLEFSLDDASFGDSINYVVTDQLGVILHILNQGNFDVNNLDVGVYGINRCSIQTARLTMAPLKLE
jgi:hypothetical protein